MFRPQDSARAKGNGRADHRAEVLRVLDLVECNDHRVRCEISREIIDRDDRQIWRERDRALVTGTLRKAIELAPWDVSDRCSTICGKALNGFDLWTSPLLDENPLEAVSVHADRLADRLEPS